MEDDIVKTVDGVTQHIRSSIADNLEGAVIELVKTYWGQTRKINIQVYG